MVETGSLLLLQAISNNDQDLALNGVLFRGIKAFAMLKFSSFSISYGPRPCNRAADALVTYGASLGHGSQAAWLEEVPDFVHVLVASDLAAQSG